MAPSIARFYCIFFTMIDPFIALLGVLMPLLDSDTYLQSFAPSPTRPPSTETKLCLDTMASCFAGTMILQLWLLRARRNDLLVWRAAEAFIVVTDIGILGGFERAPSAQEKAGAVRLVTGRVVADCCCCYGLLDSNLLSIGPGIVNMSERQSRKKGVSLTEDL